MERLLFAVEDQLGRASDVETAFDVLVAHGAEIIPAGPDREEFVQHFRTLCRPLVELELQRRREDRRR